MKKLHITGALATPWLIASPAYAHGVEEALMYGVVMLAGGFCFMTAVGAILALWRAPQKKLKYGSTFATVFCVLLPVALIYALPYYVAWIAGMLTLAILAAERVTRVRPPAKEDGAAKP